MARDYRNKIIAMSFLDICPTLDMYEQTKKEFAKEITELSYEKKKIILENSKIASKRFWNYRIFIKFPHFFSF